MLITIIGFYLGRCKSELRNWDWWADLLRNWLKKLRLDSNFCFSLWVWHTVAGMHTQIPTKQLKRKEKKFSFSNPKRGPSSVGHQSHEKVKPESAYFILNRHKWAENLLCLLLIMRTRKYTQIFLHFLLGSYCQHTATESSWVFGETDTSNQGLDEESQIHSESQEEVGRGPCFYTPSVPDAGVLTVSIARPRGWQPILEASKVD